MHDEGAPLAAKGAAQMFESVKDGIFASPDSGGEFQGRYWRIAVGQGNQKSPSQGLRPNGRMGRFFRAHGGPAIR